MRVRVRVRVRVATLTLTLLSKCFTKLTKRIDVDDLVFEAEFVKKAEDRPAELTVLK